MRPELPAPLPLLLIGGYLGAGKTTLVNHLLRQAAGRRIAVLVNDFGDINIDADLIEAEAAGSASLAGVLRLSGGCLCCSFGDDLVGMLTQLTRRQPAPDLVLIELSGVAQPAAVLRTAGLALGIEISGTLVVADAAALRRQAADRYVGDTVRQQLAQADWIVLNKPDQTDAATLHGLQAWLPSLAPQARVLACAVASLPAEWLLGWRAAPAGLNGDGDGDGDVADTQAQADALARLAARPIAAPLAAAPTAAHPLFESRSGPLPAGTDLAALGARLAAPASGMLRAKALAPDADGSGGQLLQVAGGRWAVTPTRQTGEGRLVLIGLRGQMPLADELWPPTTA